MSPLFAATLAVAKHLCDSAWMRGYLQTHLAGRIEFNAIRAPTHRHGILTTSEHSATELNFKYEFHLSYVALRQSTAPMDPRAIRERISMIAPFDPPTDCAKEPICFDTQVSFMVIGREENDWTAFCNVDTWYDLTSQVDLFLEAEIDGPSACERDAIKNCDSAKEYFLVVLSQRLRQIKLEWRNVLDLLMTRLDTYVSVTVAGMYKC